MDEPLVGQIGLRAFFDRLDAGQHVAMGQHHALGVAGGAGGEKNLERRLAREPLDRAGLFGGQCAGPLLKGQARPLGWQLTEQQRIADRQLGLHVGRHARGKLRCTVGVQRHRQHPAQDAAMEGRDPLRAVFSPEQNAVARSDAALGQQGGKPARQPRNLPIAGRPPPDALEADHRNLAVEAAEVVE